MATTSDISNGTIIRYNGDLCKIISFRHLTPGNWRSFYQVTLKNLKTGKTFENRFRSGENIDVERVETKTMQYIYDEGDNMMVMDNETFEQVLIPKDFLGDKIKYIKENTDIVVAFHEDLPISAEPPTFVNLRITYTEPAIKGDTTSTPNKPATLETGAIVNVPIFVNQGELIKVDTRSNSYCERIKE